MPEVNKLKVVIIGGVALGAGAAAKVRRMDETAEIVIIEKGPHVSFANCGLPYYLGGVIPDRNDLLLHTPESLKARFEIDVRTRQEVIAIDRTRKVVSVRNIVTGDIYEETYHKLVLALGAKPLIPPFPGLHLPGIFSVRNVPDVDAIKQFITLYQAKRVVMIGAGFIGLEMAENLRALGLRVTLIEKATQVLPPFDEEMTSRVVDELKRMGITTVLGDGVSSFTGDDRARSVILESGKEVQADVFILGLGVRPDVQLAKDAGLALGVTGALKVNDMMQTSDPDIYAGGDMAEVKYMIDGKMHWIALAGSANKQARIIGMNVCGMHVKFRGALGTSIVRVGAVNIGMTGMTERAAKAAGIPYFVSYNTAGHHASYYPGAHDITIKLIVEQSTGRLIGGEVVGREGVDKRVDVLATAIFGRMTVEDLADLDLAYAPPVSSAKDPVIMAGMAAEHVYDGTVELLNEWPTDPLQFQIVDVRRPDETAKGMLPHAINIPLDELRTRIAELDPQKPTILYCRSGQRSYFAHQILKGHGFTQVQNMSGGYVVAKYLEQAKVNRVAISVR
ncbi:FAD-dependent oxidoreductase [Sulfoacidibacillus ferrooxidans]|uniref:Coenzyme A disulfide reductase n=2 Tax=Sulfoacidibacillus ferrooxidans TaxID=2005001 RepID=A0A9X1VES8_9BACL|nr:FAD-dependent oxidoreductase [Sulfoacidibacillus ferrooxidans]MCI0184687.1 Coenzyme A disulfide reductase [Sulfoacidibacillus ferrooxidans]